MSEYDNSDDEGGMTGGGNNGNEDKIVSHRVKRVDLCRLSFLLILKQAPAETLPCLANLLERPFPPPLSWLPIPSAPASHFAQPAACSLTQVR